MAQTSYSTSMAIGQAGDLADHQDNDVASYNAVDDLTLKAGLAVAKEVGDENGARLPEGSSDQILGVALRDLSLVDDPTVTTLSFPQKSAVPVVRKGAVYVTVEEDVTPDDAVYVRFASEAEVFTVTWDGDFVASNVINGTVGGDAISQVTFDTNQATTIAALAVAIAALDSVASATVTDTREITVTGATDGEDLSSTANFTVTLGASQAADTAANVTGPSSGTTIGAFRNDSDDVGSGATAVALSQSKFLTVGSAGGVAKLDLNLP